MQKIQVWQVSKTDGNAQEVKSLGEVAGMEAEDLLEELLVQKPDMLMPNLKLVGRQTPTQGGPLDLLGVDEEGRLVVFELKRGVLRREVVAQVIDYAAQLNGMAADELSDHISERSGEGGIEKIDDFRDWYEESFPSDEADYTRPPRLALVGLGADDATRAMVSFLAESGVDITLITFHGFVQNEDLLLARQVEVESSPPPTGGGSTKADRLRALEQNARALGFWETMEDIRQTAERSMDWGVYVHPTQAKYGFYLQELTERGNLSHRIYCGAWLDQSHHRVCLEFGERAFRVASEALDSLLADHGGQRDKDWASLSLTSPDGWDKVREDVSKAFAAIYVGWKAWRESGYQASAEPEDE